MKRALAAALTALLVLSLAGCGTKKEEAPAPAESVQAQSEASLPETAAEPAQSEAAESAAEPVQTGEAAETTAAPSETVSAESAEEGAAETGTAESAEEGAEETGTADSAEEVQAPVEENVIRLAAASNLQFILDEQLIPQFEEQHPDLKVLVTYDSSERLKAEIEKGSAYDLFFCASKKPMSELVEQGLIMEDSVHFLMSNELVLFVPRTSRLGIAEITDISKANSVAIGDPADVPVGEYTIETLKEQELWNTVKEKEVYLGSSVEEVIQWVEDGEVDCGFAYRNDVITHLDTLFTVEGLAPTTYRIGILGSTGSLEAATAFSDFLQTDGVLAQFVAHGFTLPNS